jgi:hypothetical protein
MAIASLILGIIAAATDVTCCWLPVFGQIPSFGMGIAAIILGSLGLRKPLRANLAKAGLILGIVSASLAVVILVALLAFAPAYVREMGSGFSAPEYRTNCR